MIIHTSDAMFLPELGAIQAPAPLRDQPYWLCWRYEHFTGEAKPRKIPYWADGTRRHGTQGGPQDRDRLTTFVAAKDAAIRAGYDGVGFAPLADFGYVFLDFDACVDVHGNMPKEVEDIVNRTYSEYSPSGKGIRAVLKGDLGNHKSHATPDQYGFETFSSTGFVTFTGNILPGCELLGYEDHIADVDENTKALCERRFGATSGPTIDPDDFMAGREPKLGLTIGQIEELFSYLDPSMPREPWLRAGMAAHHETEGGDDGFEIWNEWSENGDTYPGTEELRKQWESFRGPQPGKRLVTMASVIKMAKKESYISSRSMGAENIGNPPKSASTKRQQSELKPFPGFMTDVVTLALKTANKRQPQMTILGVLVAMGAVCGSKSHLPDGMRLNLYGLSVAPTSSGKDHVLHVCGAIARAAEVKRLGEFASGAGLEDALHEGGMLASIDEIAHVLAARADRGNPHLREVEKMLLKLFSAGKDEHITRAKAGAPSRVVSNPALNLMGFAVPAKLGEALTNDDISSGLLNRVLITVGDGTARPEPGPRQKFELDPSMISKLNAVALSPGKVEFSTAAEQRIEGLKRELFEAEQALPEEAAERLLLGRTLEKALRIAGVLAVFDNPASPRIDETHLDWAVDFAKVSDATLIDFLNQHMHGGKVQADAARVARIANDLLTAPPPGCRTSEASALAASHVPISLIARRSRLDTKALIAAIDLLEIRGEMTRASFLHSPVAGRASKCAAIVFTGDV